MLESTSYLLWHRGSNWEVDVRISHLPATETKWKQKGGNEIKRKTTIKWFA